VIQKPDIPWAKLVRSEPSGLVVGWHSLVDHSADVAAVFEAMINVPCVATRLACLAGLNRLPDVWRPRLVTLVALHDFGKANRGFQARWDVGARPIGHTKEALTLLCDPLRAEMLFRVLRLHEIEGWGGWPQNLLAVLAHHGRPLDPTTIRPDDGGHWGEPTDDAPVRSLCGLGEAVKRWLPDAFIAGGKPLPDAPPFWHAFAGLAMLADWLGSDTDFFAFANGSDIDRMTHARACAAQALQTIGFDPAPARKTLRATPSFTSISEHPARPIQLETAEALGNVVVLESETGSGKTEAALYRFARLFAAGEVDGLYFALPTRVAATSIYNRVRRARDRIFPDPAHRPGVVLAVPGYLHFDGVEGRAGSSSAVPPSRRDDPSRACTHKGTDVGFWGLSRNFLLNQSIAGFDP
jgi:CRISPR-associated endonuclease/helicase Cas3